MPKLSQLASILNGEIPVVLIYIEKDIPKSFEVAKPEEASAMLAAIEVMLAGSNAQKAVLNGKK